jgi:hypothetical protein
MFVKVQWQSKRAVFWKHTINMQQSTIMGWLLLPTNSAEGLTGSPGTYINQHVAAVH